MYPLTLLKSPRILRLFHILSAVFNLAYVYTPLHSWRYGFTGVQFVTMPVLLVTGAMLAKGRKRAHARLNLAGLDN